MIYYKVKKEFDQAPRFLFIGNSGKSRRDSILISGELYTMRERSRIANKNICFEKINISPQNIYFCFGARFEKGE